MDRRYASYAGIAILLLLFCHRIWDLGPTHTDDATWRLAAHSGNWAIIDQWAKAQGRVFAYISGSLIYIGCGSQGTVLGSVLHVGSFAVFFITFHAVLGLYFGERLAQLAAVLNLGLFALRWEGSVIVTYPLFAWTLSSLFVISIYLGWKYSRERRPLYLIASLVLLFISLNIHEGICALFGVVAVLAALADYRLAASDQTSTSVGRQATWHVALTVGIVCLYLAAYMGWRLINPSRYEGNQLGDLNPLTVLPVLASLSTSGTLTTDLIHPYAVGYADAVAHDGYQVTYRPLRYLLKFDLDFAALATMAIVAFGIVTIMLRSTLNEVTHSKWVTPKRLAACLLLGGLIAFLPVLPVALVGKYQEHFYTLNVRSYCFTPLCHFGWAILLAAAIYFFYTLRPTRTGAAAVYVSASLLGLLAYCGSLKNDAIAYDMRRETARFRVLEQLAHSLPVMQSQPKVIHAPRLQSGTWFTVVNDDYWSRYFKACYGREMKFENRLLSAQSLESGALVVDYELSTDGRRPICVAAATQRGADGQVIATEISVTADLRYPSERAQYALAYTDRIHGDTIRRLNTLETRDGVYLLRNVQAVPHTVRICQHQGLTPLNFEVGQRLSLGSPVWFGTSARASGSGSGARWLATGWHASETHGVWSSARDAKLQIPHKLLPAERVRVTAQLSTYTGLGFDGRQQTVVVHCAGEHVAQKIFAQGDGWQPISWVLESDRIASETPLEITFSVDPLPNPARDGISSDTRDLGVCLRDITFSSVSSESIAHESDRLPKAR